MAVITHGSDLSLAPTLGPLARAAGGDVRKALVAIADAGFPGVQLDATIPGLRPRELDTSARRDLAATLGRSGLAAAGIDFYIPADHYLDPGQVDRAVTAAHAALRLTADLGGLAMCLNLPVIEAEPALIDDLITAADGLGVRLAVHHEAEPGALADWLQAKDERLIGAALEPAALLAARHDPASAAQGLGARLAVARLSDTRRGRAEGGRSVIGQGDLDLIAYRVSVDLAPARVGPVVLDLRMLPDPLVSARAAQTAWAGAAMRM